MSLDKNNRLNDFITMGDYEIIKNLKGLRKIFKTHERIFDKTGESYPYFPDEIKLYAPDTNIYDRWRALDYETIEEIYVNAWMEQVEEVIGDYVYFTVDEFRDGTAERIAENN